jgi:hypothetical protein
VTVYDLCHPRISYQRLDLTSKNEEAVRLSDSDQGKRISLFLVLAAARDSALFESKELLVSQVNELDRLISDLIREPSARLAFGGCRLWLHGGGSLGNRRATRKVTKDGNKGEEGSREAPFAFSFTVARDYTSR